MFLQHSGYAFINYLGSTNISIRVIREKKKGCRKEAIGESIGVHGEENVGIALDRLSIIEGMELMLQRLREGSQQEPNRSRKQKESELDRRLTQSVDFEVSLGSAGGSRGHPWRFKLRKLEMPVFEGENPNCGLLKTLLERFWPSQQGSCARSFEP